RIELFDDEVESIRRFDVSSQRSIESLDALEVTILQPSDSDVGHFADYLPPNAWVLLIEPEKATQEGAAYLKRLDRAADFHSVPETMRRLGEFSFATAGALTAGTLGVTCRLQIESVERFSGDIGRVREELDRVGQGHDVMVVAPTEAEVERLTELLGTSGLAAAGRLSFPIGTLKTGFRMAAERTIVVTAHELFHRGELRRMPRRRLGKAIDSFLDLREGDLVVHISHGIGRYRGLRLLEKEGRKEEHLELEYFGGTKIYVPSSKIELVQKYVGGTKAKPVLAHIGGKAWVRQKEAALKAVTDLAAEMLELQAKRGARPGIRFPDDTPWQQEFDASFPYQETPDQITAISSIKADMQDTKPMDRLLCGDVGFGKTEVAIRAAFKAVDAGYQVAVLVPTTVLAEQHRRTFSARMAEFPFEIASLSRFCTGKEQNQIIARTAEGSLDIVIGTHRLASPDVNFANLGLLIIDEEQRFGVEIKERLKAIRSTVDVLTMTATPIPRTLHMSLTGIRDISNLETPPEDRVAVETRVTRWSEKLIRNAILRELNRGGQVYFVHNRVNDIEIVAEKLKFIVPEATFGIGHGQMPEGQLEKVMVGFVNHDFDVLLATTIVESGLDIPNANTIFIDDAQRYGLADLHQLRGRVGRYKHRAYCYLLVDPAKTLNATAARRLRAIEEFSDMGAGFSIAMRDLEIRGAGNVLGNQQSGHIAMVGYELYCQLLETAVRKMQNLPAQIKTDVTIELPGEAYLPREYVSDMRSKIDLYRRLARTVGDERLETLRLEMIDRFGPLPEPVRRMFDFAKLKTEAAVWQIDSIFLERPYLVFRYTDSGRAKQLVRKSGGQLRIVDERSIYFTLSKTQLEDPDAIILAATTALSL
ncbi:MAG: transcription-repair coupling factor, partial [Planctomycetales bacterium]|nr:transcription-repair coupling factor [Planctomycetales bacterium]